MSTIVQTTPGRYKGLTAEEWRALAQQGRKRVHESFERCDTDGFLSQWASNLGARENELKAEIAENNGTIETWALFNLDGTIASTKQGFNEYGEYWVLNDMAAEKYGRRFFNPSKANKAKTRNRNNAAKGFTMGRIRIAAYVTIAGSGTGLSGAASAYPVALPDRNAMAADEFEIISPDDDKEDY